MTEFYSEENLSGMMQIRLTYLSLVHSEIVFKKLSDRAGVCCGCRVWLLAGYDQEIAKVRKMW